MTWLLRAFFFPDAELVQSMLLDWVSKFHLHGCEGIAGYVV